MKEAFEKIKERLEEETYDMEICEEQFDANSPYFIDVPYKMVKLDEALSIVSEVEAEYGNGWIPVGKDLPKDGQRVLTLSIPNIETHQINIEYYRKNYRHWYNGVIIAWMPLPSTYKPTTD